jgi:hypothetical protein
MMAQEDHLRNLSNVVYKIVDDSRFLHGLKKLQKINATPEGQPVIKIEREEFLGRRTIRGIRYLLEKTAFNNTTGAMTGYYKCSTVQTTGCKARLIDKGNGTIHLNGKEHVCNQNYRPYSALEWAALSSLNRIEHCSYIDDDMIQYDSDNEEIGNEHCAYIDDDMIQYDFTNEEIGNEYCAYIDDDMIQYDSANEEIGNEHCAYIDDDMIQYDSINEEIGNENEIQFASANKEIGNE